MGDHVLRSEMVKSTLSLQEPLLLKVKEEVLEDANDESPIMFHLTLPVSTAKETGVELVEQQSAAKKRKMDSLKAFSISELKAPTKQKSLFQIECERFLHNANNSHMLKKKKRL